MTHTGDAGTLMIDNLGEFLIKGGAFWTLWHFTRARLRQPREPVVAPRVAPST